MNFEKGFKVVSPGKKKSFPNYEKDLSVFKFNRRIVYFPLTLIFF